MKSILNPTAKSIGPMTRRIAKRTLFFMLIGLFAFQSTCSIVGQEQNETADERKSDPKALVVYNDAANFQNNGALDLAVDEWKNFLNQYPTDPKIVDAKYNLGSCYLQLKNFPEATKTLSALVEAHAEFERREDALLNLGWARYSIGLQNQPQEFPTSDYQH